MNLEFITKEFKTKVCDEINLIQEGLNRFIVFNPFMFDDGDHLVVLLKGKDGKWLFTDEGHTFMHVSYDDIDIDKGTRKKIIDTVLASYSIENQEGELITEIPDNQFGDALFSYLQGLIKITDINYLTRERVRSTFMEDFRGFLEEVVPSEKRVFDYHDRQHDPDSKYIVDCKINGMARPLFVFGILNDAKCRDVTISCLQFEKYGAPFRSMAIFEDQESIERKVLGRFSDVCDKQFSTLATNKERISKYLHEIVEGK
ncbi:MAG TPA: DUF1828 domain-containing protein [Thermodesulfovibrionales bacterium]|nr:DUF1828 domain-containing protein [Thermodesulfovibrionales bacterium]